MIFVYSVQLAMIVRRVRPALCSAPGSRCTAFCGFALKGPFRRPRRRTQPLSKRVRAIQSLKLFNRESEREGQWLNRYAEVANANVRLGRVKIAFSTINDLILWARDGPHGFSRGPARVGEFFYCGHDLCLHELSAAFHGQGRAARGESASSSASSAFISSACPISLSRPSN